MNLKLKSIADKGNLEKERLVIKVLNDTDVGEFIVMRTGYAEGIVTIGVTHTYWFQDKLVNAGDLVVLYTKKGRSKDRPMERGGTVHFFYWGIDEALWSQSDKAAVLAHSPVWESTGVDEL